MYETVEVTNRREFQIFFPFDGLRIELYTCLENHADPATGVKAYSGDLYIHHPNPEKSWANVWDAVEFIEKDGAVKPKFVAVETDIQTCDISDDENEQNEYGERIKKWLKDPQFVEKVNDMAKKLAIYINIQGILDL